MMTPQQQKAEDLKAQIGSLNDELRDTNKQVEIAHDKRDKFLENIEVLKGDIADLEQIIAKSKQTISVLHQEQVDGIEFIRVLNEQVKQMNLDIQSLKLVIDNLNRTEGKLDEEINDRRKIIAKLAVDRSDLAKIAKRKDKLNKDTETQSRKLSELKLELATTKESITKSLKEINVKQKESINKILKRELDIKNKTISINKQRDESIKYKRDLTIVEKRLRKAWETNNKGVPFPKI